MLRFLTLREELIIILMSPKEYYLVRLSILRETYEGIKKKLLSFSLARLMVFLCTSFGVYFTFDNISTSLFILFSGVILLGYLIVKYSDLKRQKKILEYKIRTNNIELSYLEGTFYSDDHGTDFIDGNHEFSHDIDLFGEHSFFYYLNRTVTDDGRKELARVLTSNDIDGVQEKQNTLIELGKKVEWRQHFEALASLVQVEHSVEKISGILSNYKLIFSKNIKYIPLIFSALSIIIIFLTLFQLIGLNIITWWFFIGLGISGFFMKRTQKIYTTSSKAKSIFSQYHPLLEEIENEEFKATELKFHQGKIQVQEEKASKIFKKFSDILNSFDQRNNLIVLIFGNAFFLWDLRNATRVENWMSEYKNIIINWFDVISYFDAQNSLANFCFNHPQNHFPRVLTDPCSVIIAEELGHPLLNESARIDNNFRIDSDKFFIVTGANMAGKSTFLRTVGLSIIMANCGLPVCARSFEYRPIRLITSMRTSDSLAQNESYFYAELKRLKYLVDLINSQEYFIILDEILKGTNSKDKAAGSRKFVERLVSFNSTGIIATHDISLCDLDQQYSEIDNYFFEAEIKNGELYFDYVLKQGICKNMNASFLLKKMDIV